jgi:prolyl 4-hydroxylase
MASSPQHTAEQLAAAGRAPEAILMLNRLAQAGNGDAMMTLALWRLGGEHMPRDIAAARDLFRRAGEAGRADAARVYTNFLAAGTGGPADWPGALRRLERQARKEPDAKAQLALIQAMALTPDGDPQALPEPEALSESPYVRLFPKLLTAAECDYLIKASTPMLQPSVVVDPRTGRQVPNPIRTSDDARFPWVILNPAVQALNRRIAAASGTHVDQGEPLQILRYRPGQEYRAHLDSIAGLDNRRILTVIVYLNDGYGGGETRFTQTGLDVRGRKGDALLFRNTLPDSRADPMSQHAGLPVKSGTKLIATRWIWEQPYIPPAPPRRG